VLRALNVKVVSGSDGRGFDVIFAIQSKPGTYTLRISGVRDTSGAVMAAFAGSYKLPRIPAPTDSAPSVVSSAASGPSPSTISSIRVTFDGAMQLSTFTPADCVLTAPDGSVVAVSAVRVVSGSGDRSFDVVFATQSKPGTYTLKIGPNVKDLSGTSMTPFQGTYRIGAGTMTYSSTTPVTIMPNGRAVAWLTVTDNFSIADLNVKVNLTYPRLMDLLIHLQAPDGTDVMLFEQMGGTSANLVNTVFDDEAPMSVALGTGPYTGSYQPLEPLSILDGRSVQGTWKLWVENLGSPNSGTVNGFSLVVTPKAG
jgi:subtilisin-like proprotein convertase family protein